MEDNMKKSLDLQLYDAVEKGDPKACQIQIQKGANIHTKAFFGTPLHYAALLGKKDVCKLLLEAGASVSSKGAHSATPLHKAAFSGETDICKYLIEAGADINARMEGGATPLDVARREGKTETYELLLKHGAKLTTNLTPTPHVKTS